MARSMFSPMRAGRRFFLGLAAVVLTPALAGPDGASRNAEPSSQWANVIGLPDIDLASSVGSSGGISARIGLDAQANHSAVNHTAPPLSKTELKKEELAQELSRIKAAQSTAADASYKLSAQEREAKRVRAELATNSEKIEKLRHEVANVTAQLTSLESEDRTEVGPVGVWLTELPHQQGIALMIGVVGVLCILGPSELTRGLLAISGSCVGALMVAACVGSFLRGGGLPWIDSVHLLVAGNGNMVSYAVWAVMLALGILRWIIGFNCALFACVDEVELDGTGRIVRSGSNLRKPLLDGEARSRPPLGYNPRTAML